MKISLTTLWKGALGNKRSVVLWYLLISLRATVPGLNLGFFLSLIWDRFLALEPLASTFDLEIVAAVFYFEAVESFLDFIWVFLTPDLFEFEISSIF